MPYEEALFWAYLDIAGDGRDLALRDRSEASADSGLPGSLGFHGGLCEMGWVTQHLSLLTVIGPFEESSAGILRSADAEEFCETIDGHLVSRLEQPWNDHYCASTGLTGLGMYLLERLPSNLALTGLELVIDNLDRLAEHTDAGVTWHTSPGFLPDWQRELAPQGYYNLGVPNGIAGVIYFLSEACFSGLGKRAESLLEGAIAWLLDQRSTRGLFSRFEPLVASRMLATVPRLAWCQGDLGILAVLSNVVHRIRRRDWSEARDALLDHCLIWPSDRSGVIDPSLCHGTAGVAHIFNRIYQRDGDLRCLHASREWFEWTLAMQRQETGVGGFVTMTKGNPKMDCHAAEARATLIDGGLGVGLSLLSALTSVEPAWDRLMLLSGRPLHSRSAQTRRAAE
jgi:hypothetical protein